MLKRLRRPGVRVRDLPAIDLVLVTHAHFDHLHRPSLRAIVHNNLRVRGTAPAIIIPSHVTDLVSDLGFSEIIELDWWDTYAAREFVGDACSFPPLGSADSKGFAPRLRRLCAARRASTRFITPVIPLILRASARSDDVWRLSWRCFRSAPTILPTFRNVHTSPADATHAFLDLKSRWMVPMHYGTFRLSHEPVDEPLQLLEKEARAAGIQDRVVVLEEGVTRFF